MAHEQTPSILSLFDYTPDRVNQARNAQDLQFALQASGNRGGLDMLSAYAGRRLGHAVGGSPLFGAGVDPELDRATKIQAVTKQLSESGIDPSDPDAAFPAMIQGFQQAGLTKEAMMAAQQYQQIQAEKAKQGNETMTAQARQLQAAAAWEKSQQEKDPRAKANLEYVSAALALGFQPKTFAEQYTQEEAAAINEYINKKKEKVAAASAINLSIDNSAKKFAEKSGTDVAAQNVQIEGKYSALASVRDAQKMLQQGIYAGFWGTPMEKAAEFTGGAVGDMKKVQNTQMFRSHIGETVIPMLKEFGGNDSNEELKYLRAIMGGDTKLDPKALAGILKRVEFKIARGIERAQAQQAAVAPGSALPVGAMGWQPKVDNSNEAPTPATPKPTKRWVNGKLVPVVE